MHRAQNSYLQSKRWLDTLNQNNIVPGLERIRKLMNLLGNPHEELKLIVVGGTNAKGSTCLNLNYNLAKSGLVTGCYTSPHIHSIRERIRINSNIISEDEFSTQINLIRKIEQDENIEASYFEIITAAAYNYFRENNVDYAIMEVGLGGEWDAVNIGNARIAILTTLGLDHIDYLGSDLDKIAETKAKIVRNESHVITGWPEKYLSFIPKCKSLTNHMDIGEWIQCTMNILNIKRKCELIQLPGRCEKSGNFIIDNAHNPQAIKFLISKDRNFECIIIGMMKDKDIENIVNELPKESEILICNLSTERSASNKEIAKVCEKLDYKFRIFSNVESAMRHAKNRRTLVTGSFYTVSEAREFLELEGHSEL